MEFYLLAQQIRFLGSSTDNGRIMHIIPQVIVRRILKGFASIELVLCKEILRVFMRLRKPDNLVFLGRSTFQLHEKLPVADYPIWTDN